jgi:hypothetical protein
MRTHETKNQNEIENRQKKSIQSAFGSSEAISKIASIGDIHTFHYPNQGFSICPEAFAAVILRQAIVIPSSNHTFN